MRVACWLLYCSVFLVAVHGSDFQSLTVAGWNVNPMAEIGRNGGEIFGEVPKQLGEYPESELLKERTGETAVTMSGGGLRAYSQTIGYLRGLLDLGVLNRTRYISSVSGGSWANAAFTYFQSEIVGLSDEEFLGEVVQPDKCTLSKMKELDPRNARASIVQKDFLLSIVNHLLFSGLDPKDVYTAAVHEVFLEPAGIQAAAQVSLSPQVLSKQLSRNPPLDGRDFIFPCQGKVGCNKPFMLLNACILGPKLAAPYSTLTDNYLPIEFSGLYVGSPQHHELRYTVDVPGTDGVKLVNFSVGGYVENFAFGGRVDAHQGTDNSTHPQPPVIGLGPTQYTSLLTNVPLPGTQFGIAGMAAASSFAPGSLLSGSPLLKQLDQTIGLAVEYWSPVTSKPLEPVFSSTAYLADSASLENNGLIAMLRRNMKEVVAFVHSPVALQPRSRYNPFKRAPTPSDVDVSFSCFFGVDHEFPNILENLKHNQVFPRYALPVVVDAMQAAQSRGKGIVVRTLLRTVENSYWGVPAGQEVAVTWVYLGRVIEWENLLPEETRKLVQPSGKDAQKDASRLRKWGPFANFPHFSTATTRYSAEQSNLMSNLAGWVVANNAPLILKALGGPSVNTQNVQEVDIRGFSEPDAVKRNSSFLASMLSSVE